MYQQVGQLYNRKPLEVARKGNSPPPHLRKRGKEEERDLGEGLKGLRTMCSVASDDPNTSQRANMMCETRVRAGDEHEIGRDLRHGHKGKSKVPN